MLFKKENQTTLKNEKLEISELLNDDIIHTPLFTGLDLVSRQHAAYDAAVATFPFGTTSLTTRISCVLTCDEYDGVLPLLVLSVQSCSFGKIRSYLQTSANCPDFRLFPPMPEYG